MQLACSFWSVRSSVVSVLSEAACMLHARSGLQFDRVRVCSYLSTAHLLVLAERSVSCFPNAVL
eukprot:8886916-Pyramimonas_sp.AAC.1